MPDAQPSLSGDGPAASIIIPYHNRADLTGPCLASLARHTDLDCCEVILIDDAGTEPFDPAEFLPTGRFRRLRNQTRKSFSANNNAAAAQAQGRHLVLLNNDTLVSPGWLQALLEVAECEPQLGVLGNRHRYPGKGNLQHAGIGFLPDGQPLHIQPGSDPDAPAVNYQREVASVTFACVLIPAEVYRRLGGLDESFRNGCEDVDFCLRARDAGYRVLYTPASVIEHHGQATPGRTEADESNLRRLAEKWAGRLPDDLHEIERENARFNADCARVRRRTYRPSRQGVHFALALGRPHAFAWAGVDLALALEGLGMPVSLPEGRIHGSIPADRRRALRRLQRRAPFADVHLKWTHYWPEFQGQPLAGDINAELFCTNYRYREHGQFLDGWMRHVALNGFRKLPVAGFNLEALLEVGVPRGDCAVVPLGYSPEIDRLFPDNGTSETHRSGAGLQILHVTNSHDLHRYGSDLAIRALGRAFGPSDPVTVHIKDYGAGASEELHDWIAAQPRFPRVVWHRRFLPKDDLLRLYAGMDVLLAPFRGEGFSMKILDAMALGVPTLMPLFGGPTEYADADTCLPLPYRETEVCGGYDRQHLYMGEGAWWCEVEFEPLVEALRALPEGRKRLAACGAAARTAVRGRFTWEAAAERLLDALGTWQCARRVTLSRRLAPDRVSLSVVIPTRDRPENLSLSLDAYRRQTLAPADYEIVLVNDHGDPCKVESVVQSFSDLPVRLLHNPGPGGPGAARNVGIEQARGSVLLITGDDIVADPGFLAAHRDAHRRWPALEDGCLGHTGWHEDMPASAFQEYLTGAGGQQFKYNDLRPGGRVPFDRFFTSNVSVKRRFLQLEERVFSDRYRFAAFEDVELGYRLHLRGMALRYLPEARAAHRHPMTPASFAERQARVGHMLAVMAWQHPDFVPHAHTAWLHALEFLRAQPKLVQRLAASADARLDPARFLLTSFEDMDAVVDHLPETAVEGLACQDRVSCEDWLARGRWRIWEAANEMILRQAMADEWAGERRDLAAAARAWINLVVLPKLLAEAIRPWESPFPRPEVPPGLLNRFPRLSRLAERMLHMPAVAAFASRMAETAPGRRLKRWLFS